MFGHVKRSVKAAFDAIGVEIRLHRNVAASEEKRRREAWQQRWEYFAQFPIRTVLDVGAHCGEFATMIHRVLPNAAIRSFEPLPDCFKEIASLANRIPQISASNVALGNTSAKATMYRSSFSPSSSLLRMGTLHCEAFPESAGITEEPIRVARLDDVLNPDELAPEILIKIDTQGYEKEVLLGGRTVLSRSRFVVVEASCYELYEGEPLFGEIHDLMRDVGFLYRGDIDQNVSRIDKRILQVDALFERA